MSLHKVHSVNTVQTKGSSTNMPNSFSDLKKQKSIRNLSEKMESLTAKKSFKDERLWEPQRDAAGNYAGIIRFLDAPRGEQAPFVRRYNHGFKVGGRWFIENCPTTLGLPCPVCEANGELWNSGLESDKVIARDRKRKESWYCNILVIKDPTSPENNGKHFLYRFGSKIMGKILEAAKDNPVIDMEGVDVQKFWGGADFAIKIREDKGYPNYDDSVFRNPSDLFGGDDEKIEALWNGLYSLQKIIDPSEFIEYNELKEKFDKIAYGRTGSSEHTKSTEMDINSLNGDNTPDPAPVLPKSKSPSRPDTSSATLPVEVENAPFKTGDDDEDDDNPLSFFKTLAN